MVVLGFDFGLKRIGVAAGQGLTGQASPLTTLTGVQQRPDWARIEGLIAEWRPDLLLVGLPLNMDGSPTDATEPARRFSRQLAGRFRLPVELVDERLTSKVARLDFGEATRKQGLDAFAAKLITESWLSEHAARNP